MENKTMERALCTFPGKFGDILWSLPTARFLAQHVYGGRVDFAVMPYYESLIPMLEAQKYIGRAFVIPEWLRTHSNYGDQPWTSPRQEGYEFQVDLGYRSHPGTPFGNPNISLLEFVASQQGINLGPESQLPFLQASAEDKFQYATKKPYVAYSFNDQYVGEKEIFLQQLRDQLADMGIPLVDTTSISWLQALTAIDGAALYVGDRSSNWVLAAGMDKVCITYEPHPSRHQAGPLGQVFGYHHAKERAVPFG